MSTKAIDTHKMLLIRELEECIKDGTVAADDSDVLAYREAVNRLITTDPPQNVVWPTKPFTRDFESFHNLWLYTEGDST
jgi:hypothetical protein